MKEIKNLEESIKELANKDFNQRKKFEIYILDNFGFEGLKAMCYSDLSQELFLLGDFPDDNPWSNLNDLTLPEAIDEIFKPISTKIPKLISEFKNRIRFIYASKINSKWVIRYLINMQLFDEINSFEIFSGNEPSLNPKPNKLLKKNKWKIPKDLKQLYSIHDGFGETYEKDILSSNDLELEFMGKSTELLMFARDDEGNTRNFIKEKHSFSLNIKDYFKEKNKYTYDRDRETWNISRQKTLFEYIDSWSYLDEEEYHLRG
ncbi:MAG: hypothetical protein HRU38_11175 [Saccharospirillaceae bacterium]|nr:hypothetical protein [Pseudomonadales bacterium]NRB79215.1 hypothetical protein [Saccharospirillaceae bacterium]